MQELIANQKLNDILHELKFKDAKTLLKDSVVTEILCRISDFSQEVEYFEKKYGKSIVEFKTKYEQGEENFEQYDDLMAWEFAQEGKKYWEQKKEDFKRVLQRY
jgi:hypothetical protein